MSALASAAHAAMCSNTRNIGSDSPFSPILTLSFPRIIHKKSTTSFHKHCLILCISAMYRLQCSAATRRIHRCGKNVGNKRGFLLINGDRGRNPRILTEMEQMKKHPPLYYI